MKILDSKRNYFLGILFIILAYTGIKLINEYEAMLLVLQNFWIIISPFVLAFVFAYVLNPLINVLEKKTKMNRSLCLTIVYLIFIAIIVVVVWFVIPKIYDSSTDLIKNIPSYFSNISDEIRSNQWTRKLFGEEVLLSIQSHMLALLPQMGEVSSNFLTSFMDNIILFGNKAFNIFIAIVLCYYILLEKEKFCSYANKSVIVCFGRRVGSKVLDIIGMLHKNIGKYLVGKTIDSIFVAVLAVIGLYFLDSKYVLLLGIIFGVTNMIPYFGPIIASLLAFAINVFYDFKIAIFVLIYLVIIQQIESLVLDPKVVGKQMGLNPFFTLMSVSVGGKLFGILGMILAVPVFAIIKEFTVRWINKKYKVIEKSKA